MISDPITIFSKVYYKTYIILFRIKLTYSYIYIKMVNINKYNPLKIIFSLNEYNRIFFHFHFHFHIIFFMFLVCLFVFLWCSFNDIKINKLRQ